MIPFLPKRTKTAVKKKLETFRILEFINIRKFKLMSEQIQKPQINLNEDEDKQASCSTAGGACWTGPRMCPGFALLGGWLVSYPILFFTGSKNGALIVMILVAIALMTGLHTRIWSSIKRLRSH